MPGNTWTCVLFSITLSCLAFLGFHILYLNRQWGNACRNLGPHHLGLCQKLSLGAQTTFTTAGEFEVGKSTRCPPSQCSVGARGQATESHYLYPFHRMIHLSLHPLPWSPFQYWSLLLSLNMMSCLQKTLLNSSPFLLPFLPYHPKQNMFIFWNSCFHAVDLSKGHFFWSHT